MQRQPHTITNNTNPLNHPNQPQPRRLLDPTSLVSQTNSPRASCRRLLASRYPGFSVDAEEGSTQSGGGSHGVGEGGAGKEGEGE